MIRLSALSALLVCLAIGIAEAGIMSSKPATVGSITIKDATLAVSSKGEESLGAKQPANIGRKHSPAIQLEGKQQMQLKFAIANEKHEAIRVHQAFVVFVHADTKQEIAFVAEPDASNKVYTFDLKLKDHATEFAGLSGTYEARLIAGDAGAANAIDWAFADVKLNLPSFTKPELPKSQRIISSAQPEITHQFRQAESRPSAFAANLFAALCAAPLLILIGAWLTIGFNFANLPNPLWVFGFHASLSAVFGLYVMFWLKLNMFVTLKYLSMILVPTFLFGHRLFRALAAKRKTV